MNLRIIGRYLGYLLMLEAACMLPSVFVGLIYEEQGAIASFLFAILVTAAAGFALFFFNRRCPDVMYAREGFVVAGGGWLLISVFGALPFVFGGEIPHFIDAFFEIVSGFTTTGASILTDVEAMSRAHLFWRSFTHWLGGIGVLAFVMAIVRSNRGAGFNVHIMRAETPGPQVSKMVPRMRDSMRTLALMYMGLSAVNLIFLLLGRMPLFDALCTMFGTAGTGGFGIKLDSMGGYSPYLQTVTTVFMALFGVNFSLYFLLLRRQWHSVLKDQELRLYVGIMLASIVAITLNILPLFATAGESIHHAAFTVSSIMTTTGFSTVNFDLWPQFSRALLLVLMVGGSMAGSTGGGIKTARLLIIFKSIRARLHRLLHPRSVTAVRINGKSIDDSIVQNVFFFVCVYAMLIIASFLIISLDNMSLETNLSAVLACINNIGPGFGLVGPAESFAHYSLLSKVILSLNMLLGRLELFPLLLLLYPSTWRKKV